LRDRLSRGIASVARGAPHCIYGRVGPPQIAVGVRCLEVGTSAQAGKLTAYKLRDRWIPVPLPPPNVRSGKSPSPPVSRSSKLYENAQNRACRSSKRGRQRACIAQCICQCIRESDHEETGAVGRPLSRARRRQLDFSASGTRDACRRPKVTPHIESEARCSHEVSGTASLLAQKTERRHFSRF
jgi:hypothetical protein